MDVSQDVKALVGTASDRGLPFALWRRPDGDRMEGIVSCEPVCGRTVFAGGHLAPFFALGRFAAPRANQCDAITADAIIRGAEISWWSEDGAVSGPTSHSQKIVAAAAARRNGALPIKASAGGPIPDQTGPEAYRDLVARAVSEIEAGSFRKVVLSRCEARPLAPDTDCFGLFEDLARKLPAAFVSLVSLPGEGTWLVGTPETLVSVRDGTLRTVALAGTQWAKDGVPLADICWPDKIIEEQALVSAYIRRALEASGLTAYEELGPHTVAAAALVHLRSDFSVTLAADDAAKLGGLLDRLSPTSAVLGMPKEPALDFLVANEGYDRGYYTGFLGPVGFDGGSDLYVNLRTCQIIGDTACLYVGGGIVAQSQPDVEWEETVQKTRTVGTVLPTREPEPVDA